MSDANPTFIHIELVHPDPNAAADALERIFGGERVEKKLAEFLSSDYDDIEVVHVRVGSVVFQYVKPPPEPNGVLDSWTNQLNAAGPSVHNVTFTIDDYEQTRKELFEAGAVESVDFSPINMGQAILGTPEKHSACCIDASELVGMRLELLGDMPEWIPGEAP